MKKTKNLKKVCACCGEDIEVKVFTNRNYRGGGHYFGKIHDGNKNLEYWECNSCYK